MGNVQEKEESGVLEETSGAGDTPVKRSPQKRAGKKKHRSKKSKDPLLSPPKVEITEPEEEPKFMVKVEAKKPLSPKQEKIETNIKDDVIYDQQPADTPNGSETDKENISGPVLRTPVKQMIIHTPDQMSPLQTGKMPAPNATSTPAVNGDMLNHHDNESDGESEESESESEESSGDEERESNSSKHHSLPDYGKFYQSSYLKDNCQKYMKRPTASTNNVPQVKNFSRPENFTYSKDSPSWNKKSGMMAMASGKGTKVVKVRASSPVQPDLKNAEVLRMSMYPAAKPPLPNEITKIEREDWPGPPSPAALLPELMRERRQNRGEPEYDEDELDMIPHEDPKVLRDIGELSKFQQQSSITQAILRQLQDRKMVIPVPLDPWKASRAPSAKYEPRIQTRHLSPMFA